MPGVRRRNDVAAKDSKGRTVVVPGHPILPGEEPETALVTSVRTGFKSIWVRFKGHRTCGSFEWRFPSSQRFELNEKPPLKGVKKR